MALLLQSLSARIKKRREARGKRKCHAGTMKHIEAGEAYKMKAHHVLLRQSVEGIRLGKT